MTDKHNVVAIAEVVRPPALMHPLVEGLLRLLGQNPTPEALEKVLKLESEWEKGEAKRAYTAALTELKRDLPTFLLRDKTVDYNSAKGNVHYTHTSLAGAMETVLPHLTAHGFSLTWRPASNEKGVTVTAILTHRQGHSEEATLTAPPDQSGNKSTPQAIASTITLLQRYSALAILGLATADMQEPTGAELPPDETRVDTAKNMRAMNDMAKGGRTRKQVEEYLGGKSLGTWTAQDLDKLRAWKALPAEEPVAPQSPLSEAAPEPDAAPDAEGSGVPLLTKDQFNTLCATMREWKLSVNQMLKLIENTFKHNPGSLQKVKKAQYAQLILKFGRLKAGEITLDTKTMKFDEPPTEAE